MMSEFWRDKRVLVTGATGIVGSWLAEALQDSGAYIVALVHDWDPRSPLISSGRIRSFSVVTGSLEDYSTVERAINEHEIDTVFHLGAQPIVGVANRSPLHTFETNIRGSYNVLEACRVHGRLVRRVVVASSDKAYGESETLPYTEDTPLRGRYPYDVSKSCVDLLAQAYWHTYQLPVAIARCGNIYGGGDLNWNRIVPGTIRSIYCGERPLIRSDGRFVRDYIYVEDAVAGYLKLAAALEDQAVRGEAFNFSNGQPIDVLSLVGRIAALMGSDLVPIVQNSASREIRSQYLCADKARQLLAWGPTFTLDDGLKATIGWYRRFLAEEGRGRPS